MCNISKFRYLLFASVLVLSLSACENDERYFSRIEASAIEHGVDNSETFKDSSILQINTFEDLQQVLIKTASNRDSLLLQSGWVKVEDAPLTRGWLKAKRQVRTDTTYVKEETVDYYSDPSVYANFNAKFSSYMVDSINKIVSPEYKISAGKSYVCRWRLFEVAYDAKDGEQVASRPSPLCALIPSTKSAYTNRGYSLYLRKVGNINQYHLDSYQLRIQWEKTSKQTIVLDIDWPFFPRDPSGKGDLGYQFIYAVSKRM